MIRVLHILLSLNVGGLETFVLRLVRKSSTEIDPHIICLEEKGVLGLRADGIPIYSLDKRPGLKFSVVKEIVSYIKSHKIDLLHTHNEGPHLYGAIAGLMSNTPVIHTRHGIHECNMRKLILERFSSLLTNRVVGVSADVSNLYRRKIKVNNSKIVTILNGVDCGLFSRFWVNRERLLGVAIPEGTIIIGVVARLAEVKDHKTLFRACRLLGKSGTKYLLVVVGDGPLKDELMQYAEGLGITANVIFTGARHDIETLMNTFDIFALSSLSEGISITLLEAMASELPVVATDVGGNCEVVVEGETGFLVKPGDADQMADRIGQLTRDQLLRRNMGKAGRKRCLNAFSLANAVKQYEELYGMAARIK